ncbi:FAP20 [Auxenochlorella protothecoides x Auxenochlorella symbiontica]
MDEDIQSSVLELTGANVSTSYISCPADPSKALGIKHPFLVLVVKNLHQYFTFEVQVLDDKNVKRRFRASNYQSTTRLQPFICTMPMTLDDDWNQIQFNLADFVKRAYGGWQRGAGSMTQPPNLEGTKGGAAGWLACG